MELEYLKVANNPIMWISVLPGVLLVIVQAIVLSRRAIVSGRKMGITERQFKSAIRSSALASIGPSLIIVTGMIALLSSMGGPIAWMRLAYIGINIGSVGGLYPDLSRTAYGVSKAAIHFLTKDIAVQYARQGVRCNAVLPGFTATDAALNNMSQAFLELFLKNVPLNRPGRPEDIADAVAFLASDRAAFITGEILPVAGGFGLPTPLYGSYMSAGAKG